MPVNYTIAADIIDIQKDSPRKEDAFFIDTNVWYWMTYTRASTGSKRYQIKTYPDYVMTVLDAGGKIFFNGLSLAELAHLIEKTEFDIFVETNGNEGIKFKEFRHNYPVEREKVVGEIDAAWAQAKSLAEPLDIDIDNSRTDAALKRLNTQKIGGYDLFFLELMAKHKILQVLTDDGDFATIPGIKVFTSNLTVIKAAQQQNKILER